MRAFSSLAVLTTALLATLGNAQDADNISKKSFGYQSDVARLRKIVINSLYSSRHVFLRELISNSNDALEKLRITSLTSKAGDDQPLNITIKAIQNVEGKGGRLVITDYGIGMSSEDLATNLGTLAKSGTSDFLSKAESDSGSAGNLIGQFGVGFYSAFLVSDQVFVASLPGATKENSSPKQYVFSSNSEDSSFDIYEDPRGNTLGRGTEITLILKEDAAEYLQEDVLRDLISKHSAFSTNYPIYLYTTKTEEVPDDDAISDVDETLKADVEEKAEVDEDEAVIEDVEETPKEAKSVPMKKVTKEEWVHLNNLPPLWQRNSKEVTTEEYNEFYKAQYKENEDPLGYHHFKGDAGSISFKAILFIPPKLNKEFWQAATTIQDGVKLMVKRVLITTDFGEAALPKWISWLKAIVDAEDLPLNVSRETIQSTRFLRQIRQVLINRAIALFARIADEEPKKYEELMESYGAALKLGAVESAKDRQKLAALTRWKTNLRNFTSLDELAETRRKGQTHIFFFAAAGAKEEMLMKSVFIEKLHARGYEVILGTDPIDELMIQHLRQWKGVQFQDVSKQGLMFGDEDEVKEEMEGFKDKLTPLIDFLKNSTNGIVRDVTVSNRLVTSACAIVADQFGYSANMERLMASQTSQGKSTESFMKEWAAKQRSLEINPRSPLIEGLNRKILKLQDVEEGESEDAELREEIQEIINILIDGALVRSGFDVQDANDFFGRIDRVLRRAVGVAEDAATDTTVKPAPDVGSAESLIGGDRTKMSTMAKELDSDESYDEESKGYFQDEIEAVQGGPPGGFGGGPSDEDFIDFKDFKAAQKEKAAPSVEDTMVTNHDEL